MEAHIRGGAMSSPGESAYRRLDFPVVSEKPELILSIIATPVVENGKTTDSVALAEQISASTHLDLWNPEYGLSGRVEDWRIKTLSATLNFGPVAIGFSSRL
jgi:hypothetical protein